MKLGCRPPDGRDFETFGEFAKRFRQSGDCFLASSL
jgi:hypothetical protein